MKSILRYSILLCVLAASTLACKKKPKPVPGKFCIHDSLFSMITFDTVRYQVVRNEISLNGKVSFDQEKVIRIYPLAGGLAEKINVELGDSVQKGQILAVISSTEIVNMKKDLSAAESDLAIAERNFGAAKDMLASGMTSQKEYVSFERQYNKAQAEVFRINSLMKLYSVDDDKPQYYIKAPISGFLVEKKINANTQIRSDNNDYIFTISDLRDVWVLANVYESDISKVSVGYPVSVKTISYPDKIFEGKIDRIYQMLDPETRSMKVRIRLDNPDYTLKPEMYANVLVAHDENRKMLAIPSLATIFDNGKNYIMLYRNACTLITQEIKIVKTAGDICYVEEGYLKEGDIIITKYQLEIYDALND
ncbi:MAG: efflux RND transporter periplasmic adaptor subunit [Cytophagaceae bacterium]